MARRLPLLLLFLLILLAPASARAQAQAPDENAIPPSSSAPSRVTFSSVGGVSADGASGGKEDPSRSGALAYGAPAPRRPVAKVFAVSPGRIREGGKLTLRVRIDEPGVRRVRARVVVLDTKSGAVGGRFSLGRVRTNRVARIAWPERVKLTAATYLVRLHVKDPDGATLARAARTSGKTDLVVVERPRPRPEKPQPEPQADPTPPVAGGGTFPVVGVHSFGSDDSRFGAGRTGHIHEGQDIMAAEGLPVVSPLAGTVAFVDYQEGGAGYYIVINADDGRSFFFAHLQKGSITVQQGQRVAEATTIAGVGTTGASSGPHLHFEIWQGGWRDRKGTPIDPLPQLRTWDR